MPSSTTALVDGGSHGSCTPELDRSPSSVSSATFGGPVTPETAQGEWAMRVTAVSGPLDAPIESLAASSGQGSSTSVSSPHRRHGVTVRDVVEGRQRPYAIVAPADELVYAQRLGPPIDLRPTERRASQAMSTSSTSLETPPSMADLVRMVDAMKTGLKAELKAELSEIHAVEMADVRRAAALEVEESRRRFEVRPASPSRMLRARSGSRASSSTTARSSRCVAAAPSCRELMSGRRTNRYSRRRRRPSASWSSTGHSSKRTTRRIRPGRSWCRPRRSRSTTCRTTRSGPARARRRFSDAQNCTPSRSCRA